MTIDSYFLSSSKKRDTETKPQLFNTISDIPTTESLDTPEMQIIDNEEYEEYDEGEECEGDEEFMKTVKF